MKSLRFKIKVFLDSNRTTILNIYSRICFFIYVVFTIIYFYAPNIVNVSYSLTSLLSVSVTGLSFTFALFVAVRSIFDNENLGHIYLVSKTDKNLKYVFKEIFTPFIWTSLLWVVVVGISISSMLISFSKFVDIQIIKYLKGVILIIVFMAALNIFGIVRDIISDTENKAKEAADKEFKKITEEKK